MILNCFFEHGAISLCSFPVKMYGVQDGLHFFLPFRSFNQGVGESYGKDVIVLTMDYFLLNLY
jgi:hypothetical protein